MLAIQAIRKNPQTNFHSRVDATGKNRTLDQQYCLKACYDIACCPGVSGRKYSYVIHGYLVQEACYEERLI